MTVEELHLPASPTSSEENIIIDEEDVDVVACDGDSGGTAAGGGVHIVSPVNNSSSNGHGNSVNNGNDIVAETRSALKEGAESFLAKLANNGSNIKKSIPH